MKVILQKNKKQPDSATSKLAQNLSHSVYMFFKIILSSGSYTVFYAFIIRNPSPAGCGYFFNWLLTVSHSTTRNPMQTYLRISVFSLL